MSSSRYSHYDLEAAVVDLSLTEHSNDDGSRKLMTLVNYDPVTGQKADMSTLYFRLDGTPSSENFSRYQPLTQCLLENTYRQLLPDGSVHQQKSSFYRPQRGSESRRFRTRPDDCPEPSLWWLDWLDLNPNPGIVAARRLLAMR